MEKMLVVVFDNEKKAYEGLLILKKLNAEGSVTVHAASVIGKNEDGTLTVKEVASDFPIHVVEGTAIGGLIGLLGGPIGVGVGATVGTIAGATSEIYNDIVDSDFLAEVYERLTPGKFALVSDLSEEWVTPLDTRMEGIGGIIFRTARVNFEDVRMAREIKDLKAEVGELKAEIVTAPDDYKAKLQAKIEVLNTKLKNKQEKAKQRLDQRMSEIDMKIKSLEEGLAKAKGDAKKALNARKSEMSKDYNEVSKNLKNMEAEHQVKVKKKIEKKKEIIRK